jgi:hypothetical protein
MEEKFMKEKNKQNTLLIFGYSTLIPALVWLMYNNALIGFVCIMIGGAATAILRHFKG